MLTTNLLSAAIVGNKVTWSDVEGIHMGTVEEVWEDQGIAVCTGHEHRMDFTAFVPVTDKGEI